MLDEWAEYPEGTYGRRMFDLDKAAREAGAWDVVASLEQIEAKRMDHLRVALFGGAIQGDNK